MSKRSLDPMDAHPDPFEDGGLHPQDLLSADEQEQSHPGPSKRPRNFIASVVSTLTHLPIIIHGT